MNSPVELEVGFALYLTCDKCDGPLGHTDSGIRTGGNHYVEIKTCIGCAEKRWVEAYNKGVASCRKETDGHAAERPYDIVSKLHIDGSLSRRDAGILVNAIVSAMADYSNYGRANFVVPTPNEYAVARGRREMPVADTTRFFHLWR